MGQEEFEGFHQHKHSVHITVGFDQPTLKVLERIVSPPIQTQLKKIIRSLDIIMASQAEFDAQVQAANDKLDALGAAIQAEAQQIADFIASAPAGLDTSTLDGVNTRLGAMADSVSGIFTPPETPAP